MARLGVWQAATVSGLTTTKLYVAFAKRLLPGVITEEKLWFERDDVLAYRDLVEAEKTARQAEFRKREAEKFARINRRR